MNLLIFKKWKIIFKTATQNQIDTILKLHNEYRKLHGADPLVYDPIISEISQSYAILLATTDTIAHSTNFYGGDLYVHFIKNKKSLVRY